MFKLKYNNIFLFLFYVAIFTFLLYNSFNALDNDLGWHLRVGEKIWQEQQVPNYDYYNYTLEGQTWVDHEWLLNLITFLIYNKLGYLALSIFFALIPLIILILLRKFYHLYYARDGVDGFIMFWQFFGVWAMSPHLGVRMQEFTLLNLVLLLFIIKSYEKSKNFKVLFWLIPLFYVWANLHGGFLIGIFLAGLWVAIKTTERLLVKYKYFSWLNFSDLAEPKQIWRFSVFAVLATATTFFTPYGLKLYSLLQGYTNTFYQKVIAEWLPFNSLPIKYPQIIYDAVVISLLIIIFYWLYNRRLEKENDSYKISLWQLALATGFLILAFKSRRHFPLFFMVTFPLVVDWCKHFFIVPAIWLNRFKTSKIIKVYFLAALLLIIVSCLSKTKLNHSPFAYPGYCVYYPCQAINFITTNPAYSNLKILNNYGWGGWMLYVWPEKKLFIDGRFPQYSYRGHSLLEEYFDFFKPEKIATKLNDYGIELVLIKRAEKIKLARWEEIILGVKQDKLNEQAEKNNLQEYLNKASGWKMVYSDRLCYVYVRGL